MRVWRARADGTGAAPVSKLDVDARSVRWSADGDALIVGTRPGIAMAEAAIEVEERTGFLFDRRFWPLSLAQPVPSAALPAVEQVIRSDDEIGRASCRERVCQYVLISGGDGS